MSQYAAVQDELIEHGMLMLPQQRRRLQWMTFGIASVPLLFAFTRFMNAMIYNHPAGYLVGLVILTTVLSFFVLANFPRCTKAGERLVADARSKQTTSAWQMTQTEAVLPAPLWAIAVFGLAAVDPADRGILAATMINPNQSSRGGCGSSGCSSGASSGCGSSGGGGGGGCGGGGGGCGGCGSG